MKKIGIILVFSFCSMVIHGQQENIFSQWCFNQNLVNPALSGIKNYQEFKLISRFQWVGFEGAPVSNTLNYSTQIYSKRTEYLTPRHGISFQFDNDKIGSFGSNRILFGYAVHRNFTKDTRFSVGMRGGLTQLYFDNSNLNPLQPDPSINRNKTLYLPNVSLGMWWNTEKYYVGFTLQQLMNSNWENIGSKSSYNTHLIFTTGTRFQMSRSLTFMPNLLISKTFSNPIRIDAIGYFDFNNQFKIGFGLRNNESIIGIFQVKLNHQFFIGYSIDYVTNGLNTSSLMSHEINLQFAGSQIRDTEKLACPMF
jgi:type IX secretion system PorP/SprF family membrane protein